jgi:L-ascorbate oxidase
MFSVTPMFLLTVLTAFSSCLTSSSAILVFHDRTFQPDLILRVSAVSLSRDCRSRELVVANGTSPGPELRIKGGETTWIRVYNDMRDQNLTMVSIGPTCNALHQL